MPRAGLTATKVAEAAADLADADGLDALTLAGVAARLDVKTPSLYNHVDGLDRVLEELAILAHRRLTDAVAGAAVGRSGDDALLAIAEAYRHFAADHPGLYAAMMRISDAAHSDSARLRSASEGLLHVVVDVLGAESLGHADTIHTLRALRAAMHGFADLERLGAFGYDVDLDTSYRRLIGLILAGLSGT